MCVCVFCVHICSRICECMCVSVVCVCVCVCERLCAVCARARLETAFTTANSSIHLYAQMLTYRRCQNKGTHVPPMMRIVTRAIPSTSSAPQMEIRRCAWKYMTRPL